jgi:hypothetical protein
MLRTINKILSFITLNIISKYNINKISILIRRIKNLLDVKLSGVKKIGVSFSNKTFDQCSMPYITFTRSNTSLCLKKNLTIINYNKILIRSMHRSTGTLHFMGTIVAPKIKCNASIKRYLPDNG